MLAPGTTGTFQEYIETIFKPFIVCQIENVNRVDIVWDVYRQDSLKASTREKRGSGQRRKVLLTTRIPSNWRNFLRVDENKSELFLLLAEQIVL